MDIEQLVASRLKASLVDAGLSEQITYSEEQLRSVLLTFLASIKEVASEVCSPFNSFALLCALQHNIPVNIIKPKLGFEADAQILFNNATALAFRFSSPIRQAKTTFNRADYALIAESDDLSWLECYLEVIRQIYYLVEVIDFTVKKLRCLGKGARATIDLSTKDIPAMIKMEIPVELLERMGQYDERLIRNQNILVKQAIPLGFVQPESPLRCVVVNPNWSEFRKGNLDPAPTPLVFGMDAIYTFVSIHSEEILKIFDKRVHAEDLFVFMAALFQPLVEKALNNTRFAGQGYSFTGEQELSAYIANCAPNIYAECFGHEVFSNGTPFILESLSQHYWQEVVPRMLSFVSHDFALRDSIDPILFRPVKFAYKCDDGTIFLHLGSVIHFFAYFLDQFQNTGQFGEIKGRTLEALLLFIIESIPGFKRIWESGRKLEYQVAGKMGTDVDVFVQRDELALLISCKSHGVNREYELGNGQECWDRSEESKAELRFARQTAMVMAEHREELNLPKNIKGILPFVCTGWPEYLFEPTEDYFMDDGTPRIMTVREIEEFCRNIDSISLGKLLYDPWIVAV